LQISTMIKNISVHSETWTTSLSKPGSFLNGSTAKMTSYATTGDNRIPYGLNVKITNIALLLHTWSIQVPISLTQYPIPKHSNLRQPDPRWSMGLLPVIKISFHYHILPITLLQCM
jgi:hypothetical protein